MPPRPSNHFHSPLLFRAAAAVLPEHLLCAFHLLQGFECRRLKSPEIPNAAKAPPSSAGEAHTAAVSCPRPRSEWDRAGPAPAPSAARGPRLSPHMQEPIAAALQPASPLTASPGGPQVPPRGTPHPPPTAVCGPSLHIGVTPRLSRPNRFCEIGSESTPTGSVGGNVDFGDTRERLGLGGIPHLAPEGSLRGCGRAQGARQTSPSCLSSHGSLRTP